MAYNRVFVPGSGPITTHPEPVEFEEPQDHFLRALSDLNQPARAWKTAKVEAAMQALLGSESRQVVRRVHALAGSYQTHLRDLVDCWIGTGIGPAKLNRPASRHPNRMIHDLVTRVLETHRAVAVAVKDGYVVLPVPKGDLMLDGDGGVEAAELMLVEMLVSPWRLKIAKCVGCDRYFSLKQWERAYKDGTVCPECEPWRKTDRSAKSQKSRREVLRQKLYDEAARRFGRRIAGNPQWKNKPGLKDTIAVALTRQIQRDPELTVLYPDGVTAKWIALAKNGRAIEAAVRRLAEVKRWYS